MKGVIWHKRDMVWSVRITINKKQIHLGDFLEYSEAAAARIKGEKDYASDQLLLSPPRTRRIGMKHHPLYNTWNSMWSRCRNPNNPRYPNYGGRGITVCPEWKSFKQFVDDMGEKSYPTSTLYRIDGTAGYSKGNCRWASKTMRGVNRRIRGVGTGRTEKVGTGIFSCKEGEEVLPTAITGSTVTKCDCVPHFSDVDLLS